MHII
ncbi:mannose-1-phosphate guanylyltransferase/mannose-6-phosphate isomerase, partial [Yersinia pestis PY-96]